MSDNIQEAEVGSGTKISDTKKSEKRAQITLKAIQLRLKQEKERAALQQQKKSLQVKENIGESFSPSQIAALKAEYSKINGIDPASDTYKKLIAMLDRLDLKSLQSLAGAEIKFVSKLAQNRVARKSMKEEVQLDELSNEKLGDYKKKAGADASAADKAGDMKKGNKRFSGIMKATKKQFDNDAKKGMSEASQRVDSLVTDALKIMKGSELKDAVQALKTVLGDREYNDRRGHYNFYVKQLVDMYGKKTNEELSPKQKEIDKNKNGKIDGFDLAHLRKKTEELSPKQKALDKNKNGKIDGSDLAKLRKEEVDLQEKSDYEVYHKDYSTAVQTAIKQAEKRGYEVDMDDWHDKVATGPKKPSSGKTNSFSINLMKDGKPAKKKLQMQVYNMDNHKYELNMYIEEVEIAEAGPGLWANIQAKRERIKAGSNERMRKPGEKGAPESDALDKARGKNEAASPAQQAAIAIAMKKDGKKPKDMEEMTGDDKSSIALQAMVARKKLQQTAGKNKSQSFIDKMTSKANAGDRLPKKPADEYDRKVVKYLKKKHGMSEASVAETYEGVVDKIKAIKRGMQAKAKADDHFDKAGDPKNANASKDLKKAVRYHNLLNKEEVVLEAKKSKTFKNIKKKMKEEETPNKTTIKKGDMLTGKREPIEINPELKEPAR